MKYNTQGVMKYNTQG